jgi:hypothetical protein
MKYNKRKRTTPQYRRKQKKSHRQKNLREQKKQQEQEEKTTLFRKLINVICRPNKLVHFFIATLAVGVGFIFNTFDKIPLFGLKALFGFALYLILSYTIKYIEKKNNELMIELTGDPQLVKCQINYAKKINSNFNFMLCVIACTYFVAISIILGFVKINLIGIYSLIALACVVFCAFIVFQQYIFILFLLHDISKISPGRFYELIPERTEWFNFLERFSNICRDIFIVLGSLFILLFIVFSPVNSIQIIFQENFSSSQYIPLLCTWMIILIAIVFMVPLSSFVRNFLLHKTYENLAAQSIDNYNHLYESSENDSKIVYMDIILRLNDRRYTLRHPYTWVIPVIVSITNFSSVIISIIVDLKDIGLLA